MAYHSSHSSHSSHSYEGIKGVEAFDRIHQAIDAYCLYERENLLDNIFSEFSDQCKDLKSVRILEDIIGYYRQRSPATTPGGYSQPITRKSGKVTTSATTSTSTTESKNTFTNSTLSSIPTSTASPVISYSLPSLPSLPSPTSTFPHTFPSPSPSHVMSPASFSSPASPVCTSIIKSGARKGNICGSKVYADGFCKRHQVKGCTSGVTSITSATATSSEEKCPALLKAGVRKGQICGACVANGETYCGKHKVVKCIFKLENGDCCGRSISLQSPSETHCRIHVKNELSLDTKKFVTSLNRFGNMEHKYSGLVFENKKVVGAQHPSGTIITNLNDDDLECAIIYGLPIETCFITQMTDYLNRRKRKESIISKQNESQ